MTSTLKIDTLLVDRIQQSGDFDYNRDIAQPNVNLLDLLTDRLNDWWEAVFGGDAGETWFNVFGAILVAFVTGLAIFYLLRYLRRRRLGINGRACSEAEDADSIYGLDFDRELARALKEENYSRALRTIYLRTLRALHDGGQIAWSIAKTPRELADEISSAEIRTAFAPLSAAFVRVRYGHFPASSDDYQRADEAASRVRALLEKGGGK